jgi:hypothetical protein
MCYVLCAMCYVLCAMCYLLRAAYSDFDEQTLHLSGGPYFAHFPRLILDDSGQIDHFIRKFSFSRATKYVRPSARSVGR